ncbi:hypothetical protein Pam2_159 [Pseudanabaena phage Pam2]|nr:hypothetical protein Pam2_159 [Pseudanabaena phage Pam2]
MPRVRVEKFHDNFYLQIDGQPKKFNLEASNLLTSPILAAERSGIFSCSPLTIFSDGVRKIAIDFHYSFNSEKTDSNPLTEIHRRVRLVQETFAKAEAEKEVWEGIVGEIGDTNTELELFDVLLINRDVFPPVVVSVQLNNLSYECAAIAATQHPSLVCAPSGKFSVGDEY